MIMANRTFFYWSAITVLSLALGSSTARAWSEGQFGFLLHLHPKVSTSMIITGPEHVERVQKHSLVFSPKQARKVLPELDKVFTKHRGWTRLVSKPGEYVAYKRGTTHVSYMSDRVYRNLTWPGGTKLLPTQKGGCVVEYFHLKK